MSEWREIAGYPGYEVSSAGEVRSWRVAFQKRARRRESILLVQTPKAKGYMSVSLRRPNGGSSTKCVHTLVLEAFFGPRPEGMVCRHFPDRDTTNNSIDNLSWGTPLENANDRRVHGTAVRGERVVHSRLTTGSARLIMWLRRDHGVSTYALAEWFGVGRRTVRDVISGRSWALAVKP